MAKILKWLFLFCFVSKAFPQAKSDLASIIIGSWLPTESILSSEIESPFNSSYIKYEFRPDSMVGYGTNEFETGKRYRYKVKGDTIQMFYSQYRLESYNDGVLKLQSNSGKTTPHIITWVRKEKYDSLWTGKVDQPKPVFTGNFHLHDYVFSSYNKPQDFEKALFSSTSALPAPKEDVFIKVTLTIDGAGKVFVNKVEGMPRMNEKKISRIKTKLENTGGYWRPAQETLNNKSSALVLTFVSRGKSTLKFRAKANEYFERSYLLFQRADYIAGVQMVTNAIQLVPDRYQFYMMRAACYIQVNEIDRYCEDMVMANRLNPFVELENIESVNGENIRVQCGVK